MGAGAFVMASYTQIPYTHIVVVSFLPALFIFPVGGLLRPAPRRSGSVFDRRGGPWHQPDERAQGGWCGVRAADCGTDRNAGSGYTDLCRRCGDPHCYRQLADLPRKMGPRDILDALALGSRNMVTTGLLLVAVGLVVNVIAMTGVGNTLS